MSVAPRFAFLVLEEHPYGREMLSRILGAGFQPLVVVSEDSELASEERTKFEARIAGHDVAPPIREQCAERAIDVVRVDRHRSSDLVERLEPLDLDLVVLGGTRILRGGLLDLPRDGVLNSHPGLLPECRGSASPAWSVIHDIPIGATTHFCDPGIDTGDVVLRRELSVERGATYEDLCHGTLVLAGCLMAEALGLWADGQLQAARSSQGPSDHPTFKNAPPDVIDEVRRKLREGTYACFRD
ncbi:MAG: formyltransferase family protein [Planctomycetota bacterium]|jgi:methionyl-tRNA formyltransferase